MNILIEGTAHTPTLQFNSENKEWIISGRSFNQSPANSYAPILQWIKDYEQNPTEPFSLQFRLEFFDTSSFKMLLDILLDLKNRLGPQNELATVHWYYESEDEDMKDSGETLMLASSLKFEMVCY